MRSLRFFYAALALIATLWLCSAASAAQDGGKAPAGSAITIRVANLEGEVEVKLPGSKEWIPAKVDMRIGQGAEIQTGMFSWVDLRLANDTTTRLDSVTRMRVDKYLQDATAVRTTLHVRSGGVAAVVHKGKLKSDFRISTPRSTMSVRGSQLGLLGIAPCSMGGDRYRIGPTGQFFILAVRLGRPMSLGSGQKGYACAFFLIDALMYDFLHQVDLLPLGSTDSEGSSKHGRGRSSGRMEGGDPSDPTDSSHHGPDRGDDHPPTSPDHSERSDTNGYGIGGSTGGGYGGGYGYGDGEYGS